jgi:hypothetical protein
MFKIHGNELPDEFMRTAVAVMGAVGVGDYFKNTEDLPVNLYTVTALNDWVKIGASPYIDVIDEPANYIYDRNDDDVIGDFGFKRSAQTGIPGTVKLKLYCKRGSVGGTIEVYVDPGTGYVYAGTVTPDESYSWKEINVTSILDTNVKVAAAKMYLKHQGV